MPVKLPVLAIVAGGVAGLWLGARDVPAAPPPPPPPDLAWFTGAVSALAADDVRAQRTAALELYRRLHDQPEDEVARSLFRELARRQRCRSAPGGCS